MVFSSLFFIIESDTIFQLSYQTDLHASTGTGKTQRDYFPLSKFRMPQHCYADRTDGINRSIRPGVRNGAPPWDYQKTERRNVNRRNR
jgi:hypothetical protein